MRNDAIFLEIINKSKKFKKEILSIRTAKREALPAEPRKVFDPETEGILIEKQEIREKRLINLQSIREKTLSLMQNSSSSEANQTEAGPPFFNKLRFS